MFEWSDILILISPDSLTNSSIFAEYFNSILNDPLFPKIQL